MTVVVSTDSSQLPLKDGSIHFHHQKPEMPMFITGVSSSIATLHFFLGRSSTLLLARQVFKPSLGSSSNLLLAGLPWQVFKTSLGRSSNLPLAGLQIFSWQVLNKADVLTPI